MRKLKLYLETSVWNFYFADDAPEKKEITLAFFDKVKAGEYDIYISDIVLHEIMKAETGRRNLLLDLIKRYAPNELNADEEAESLAEKYIEEGVLTGKSLTDASHAAVATISEMDALISWNLKHLANLNKMNKINGINLREGYSKRLELITPMEVSGHEI